MRRGIYALETDTLKLCFPLTSEQERPKDFTGKAGFFWLELTRGGRE